MERFWHEAKAALVKRIPSHTYRMWIAPLQLKTIDQNEIRVLAPDHFSKKRVLDNFGQIICTELQRITGRSLNLSVHVIPQEKVPEKKIAAPEQLPLPNMSIQPHYGRLLHKEYTFDQFVVGKNNDFAYTAALSLAARNHTQQNALFLLSKTGMGKSHLSQAIGHHILKESPNERVYYMTAEDFTNEMVASYKSNSINLFKDKYHKCCDVLLLEDVQYLSGKDRTQIELAHTLDSLFNDSKKIIFSSCYAPSEIPKLNDNLRSRLTSGLISSIDPPKYQLRLRILKRHAKTHDWKIPISVLEYLASELTQDVRQLKSGLMSVTAKASLLGRSIDLELAASVIKNMVQKKQAITIGSIKKLVCKYYKLSPKELVSKSRKHSVVRPRQVAMYLSRRYTDQPLQAIGKSFNRYHATALHAIGSVEKGLSQGGPIQGQIEYLTHKLESGNF
ncbi:MAG: chromosomal replication initiator protein DnaA [Desulfobacteraceae bacterium]